MDRLVKIINDLDERVHELERFFSLEVIILPPTGRFVVSKKSSDPSIPASTDGEIYYNTTTNKFRGRENGAWVNLV